MDPVCIYIYCKRRVDFPSSLFKPCFPGKKIHGHHFQKTRDLWCDSVLQDRVGLKNMTWILILRGWSKDKIQYGNWVQRGWDQSQAQFKKKEAGKGTRNVRSDMERRAQCHAEEAKPRDGVNTTTNGSCHGNPHWKAGNWILETDWSKSWWQGRGGKDEALRWSQTEREWNHHAAIVPARVHITVTRRSMTDLKGRSVQPAGLWVNVLESAFCGITALVTHPAEQCDGWVESLLKYFQEE